jgi:diguanylate cyclase
MGSTYDTSSLRGQLAGALAMLRSASVGRALAIVGPFVAGVLATLLFVSTTGQNLVAALNPQGHWQGQLIALLLISAGILTAIYSIARSERNGPQLSAAAAAGRTEFVAREVRNELTAVLALIRGHMEAQHRYDCALAKVQSELGPTTPPEQVWTIVKILIDENEKIRADAAELKSNLQKSKLHIDELRSNLASAQEAALLDPLTTVGNRRRFEADLEKAVTQSHKDKTPLCLVIADLDNFKGLNDRFGHLAGDEVLRQFADLLVKNVKGRDRVARFGGEEFALLLPYTPMGNAYHLTEQIRAQVEQAVWLDHGAVDGSTCVTASFGIAQLRDGDTGKDLLMRADSKLYEAKKLGRNRVEIENSLVA